MEAVPDQSGKLSGPAAAPATPFVCPDCGKSYDSQFGLSYHRKLVHDKDDFAEAADDRQALSRIRNAVIAGFVSTAVTVIFALVGLMDMDAWALIEAGLFVALTIGVWNRNRGCAIALFSLWIIEKLLQLVQYPGSFVGLPVAIALAVFFWQGISGTFAYHRGHVTRSQGGLAKE